MTRSRRSLIRRLAAPMVLATLAGLTSCRAIRLPGGLTVNFPGFTGKPIGESELSRRVRLPDGFTINTYASGIENARMLRLTAQGDVLVSAPRQGKVFLIEPGPTAAIGSTPRVLLAGLDAPHGLAVHDGWLYVATSDTILRVRFDSATRTLSGSPEVIVRGIPKEGQHWTRTIGIGPDGWLYLSVGSSCNVCIESDVRRAAITRYRLDGSGEQLYATGLRNAVGFAWQPGTDDLYATDNGRDLLGDDFPPCELDRIVESGFYGWPFANGARLSDPDFGPGNETRVAASLPPAYQFGAHTAPLGITFYDANMFPAKYRGAALVALHGSWNRSEKNGYKLVALFIDPDGKIHGEDFATGFEHDNEVIGRPVDVAVAPDGALFVSDDYTGSIYRIAYGETPAADSAVQAPRPTLEADPLAKLSDADRAAATARGAALWQKNDCSKCHLPGAETYRPLHDLARKYTLDSLANYLKVPQPPMPAFPLSDSERRDLAVYLLATHGS